MKPIWIIQENIDEIDAGSVAACADRHGMDSVLIEHTLGYPVDIDDSFQNKCCICYGSIDFVRRTQKYCKFIPGSWCNFNNLKCSAYYAFWGEHLLNHDYRMMPIGDLSRFMDNNSGSFFVRPDNADKPFTGQVILDSEKHKIQTLCRSVWSDTLVVVAPYKSIEAEYRFVICDRKVIDGCRYLPSESTTTPPSCLRLAKKISEHNWQPDLCYTVDICELNGTARIIEFNSFSSAGFYKCDLDRIIRYASIAAIKEWQEYF